jgi:hypothetical protein
MENEEIINGLQRIMDIALQYSHPSNPDVDDWHAVHSIAETIYSNYKNPENAQVSNKVLSDGLNDLSAQDNIQI